MIDIYNISVMNLENAIRGARNPLDSWDRSDSKYCNYECLGEDCKYSSIDWDCYLLGENDLNLALRLTRAGSDHAKFLRQIFVSMDIDAPLYWWKEMDKYAVGTTTNSCSTMHTIHKNPFSIDMFSVDVENTDLIEFYTTILIPRLEYYRKMFLNTGDKKYWRELIQLLPSSFNQLRTWTGNYANLRNIYYARKNHKLQEWIDFCSVIEQLPYSELITVE